MSPLNAVSKQPDKIFVSNASNCFNFHFEFFLGLTPVIQEIFDGNHRIIPQNPTINNAIATFSNHILIRQEIGRQFQLSQCIPPSPPQVRHLRTPIRRRIAPIITTVRPYSTLPTVGEHHPVLRLSYFDLDIRRGGNGAAGVVVDGGDDLNLLDFLGN
uniref:Uncharacterized protein n=1 Tax=Opuntia streptacantha TaxID=393608 RepID=A0A7C9CLH3_OPUST